MSASLIHFSHFIAPYFHSVFYITVALIIGITAQFLAIPISAQIIASIVAMIAGLIYKSLFENSNLKPHPFASSEAEGRIEKFFLYFSTRITAVATRSMAVKNARPARRSLARRLGSKRTVDSLRINSKYSDKICKPARAGAYLFFLLPLAFLAGSALCFWQQQAQNAFQSHISGQTIDIQGSISNIESIQNPRFKYKLIVDLARIKIQEAWNPETNSIALYVRAMPKLLVGDSIAIKQLNFKEIANQSFKNYLAKEKIAATVFIDSLECTVIDRPKYNLNRTIFYFRKNIFDQLHTKINRQTFALFSSIFLGNRTAVKKQMDSAKEPFKVWGTSHYLARSGLHLVIFVIVWHFILSLIPIAYLFKQVFLIFLILIYALLSWSSISFERALLMFFIYKLCLLNRVSSHYVHLVTVVTFLVLCINPLQLFFLDFQLSFGLTFALAWFNHVEAYKKRVL